MKLNFKEFKKIKSGKDHTVLRHDDGHELRISHEGLSPKIRGEIARMSAPGAPGSGSGQHYAEGDLVQPEDMQSVPYERSPELDQEVENLETVMQQADPYPQPQPEKQYSVPQGEQFQLAPGPQNRIPGDTYGMETAAQNYGRGIQKVRQGIEGEANALAQQAREEQPVYDRQADQIQKLEGLFNQNKMALDNERQTLMQDAMKGHVDPNRLWGNKSTLGKVGTIVGLIIGGLGGSDAPMKTLRKQIDDDINAQKLDMENRQNLLNANRDQYKNERDATDMTRINLMDQVSAQLKLAASKATDPLVKARAEQAAGKWEMEIAPIMSQMTLRRSMIGGGQSGQLDPETMIRFNPMIDDSQKEHAFKEIEEARGMYHAKDNILGSFDKLNEINTVGGALMSPLQTSKQASAIRDPLIASLSKATAGRFSEADAQYIGTLFPAKGDSEKTVALKRQQMNKIISEKMNFPRLKSLGINTDQFGRHDSQGQKPTMGTPGFK